MSRFRIPLSATSGALLAIAVVLLATLSWAGWNAEMGFGTLGDPLVALGLFVVTTLVMAGPAWLALTVLRRLPGAVLLIGTASAGAGLLFLRPRDEPLLDAILLGLGVGMAAWIGAAAGRLAQVLAARRAGGTGGPRARHAVVHVVASGAATLLLAGWLFLGHSSAAPASAPGSWGRVAPLEAPDPAEPGPHAIDSFTYGSGSDLRRPAYAEGIALATLSLDLRPLLPGFTGIEARLHRTHWGFGLDSVPLNATVWMPAGPGPYPVVLFVPGMNPESERSELGYEYLGRLLASRGFVFVATDMNFLRGPHIADRAAEMPVRAWLALKHLDLLHEWGELHPEDRAARMDLDRIVLGGHSRGGEAAALAALVNSLERYPGNAAIPVSFGHAIRGVFALAPTDRLYPIAGRGSTLTDLSYMVLHGSHDGDVSSFQGTAQYHRVSIPEGSPHVKASIYVVGANHSSFNARRRGRDVRGVAGLLLDPSRLLDGEAQRRATAVFVSAFVETVLAADDRYRGLFEDPRTGWPWLPPTHYVSRFEDGLTRTVASFEEDLDPVTATLPGASFDGHGLTLWREEPLALRTLADQPLETQVARLAWRAGVFGEAEPSWEIRLPDPMPEGLLDPSGRLRFSMGHTPGAGTMPRLSVELESSDGTRARVDPAAYAPEPPAELPRLWRLPLLDALLTGSPQQLLGDYLIPLEDFRRAEPAFDPARTRTIRFVFDRDPSGTVLLDDIGFRVARPDRLADD